MINADKVLLALTHLLPRRFLYWCAMRIYTEFNPEQSWEAQVGYLMWKAMEKWNASEE